MTENKYLKWAIILGIIIILNLFFVYTMKVVYKAPQWDNFCQKEQIIESVDTQEACLEKGGQWNENLREAIYDRGVSTENGFVPIVEKRGGYCNLQFVCQNEFKDARENYEKNVFMTLIGLGVLSIVISFLIASEVIVSMGLSLGGVFSFVVASIRYWRYASEYLQVGILALALMVLIYLGIKKFK